MADLSPNHTPRYKVQYSTGGKKHSATFRYPSSLSPAACADATADIFGALVPILYADFAIVDAVYAPLAGDVFLPAPAFEIIGTLTGVRPSDTARQLSVSGRAATGKKASLRFFGVGLGPGDNSGDDFRIYLRERGDLAALFEALATAPLLAPDGAAVASWYPYVNVSFSAYWQRALRG